MDAECEEIDISYKVKELFISIKLLVLTTKNMKFKFKKKRIFIIFETLYNSIRRRHYKKGVKFNMFSLHYKKILTLFFF